MEANFRQPDFATDWRPAVYQVRLWVAPSDPLSAWALDDWELTDANSVVDVVAWANNQDVDAFEIFVRVDPNESWIQIHGEPADGRETTVEIVSVRDS